MKTREISEIRLTENRLLVELFKVETTAVSEGGIILPGQEKINPDLRGIVIAKSPKCVENIKVGDEVVIPNYAGKYVSLHPNKEHIVIKEAEIIFYYGNN